MDTTPIKKRALRPQEAAEALSTSLGTLARRRATGVGPGWFKQGKNVYYSVAELDAWLRRGKVMTKLSFDFWSHLTSAAPSLLVVVFVIFEAQVLDR